MKRGIITALLIGCFIRLQAQTDSIPFYRHTIGVDVLWLTKLIYVPIFYNNSDINIDLLYRYQLTRKWGINLGMGYRMTETNNRDYTLNKIKGTGYNFRIGPIYNGIKINRDEGAHLSIGINALASFLNDRVFIVIPNSVWGDYKENYSINRTRYGAELELGLEESLSDRVGARVIIRAGYAPTQIDRDGLKGEHFPGIYSWFNSSDTYFYTSLFMFLRSGNTKK